MTKEFLLGLVKKANDMNDTAGFIKQRAEQLETAAQEIMQEIEAEADRQGIELYDADF